MRFKSGFLAAVPPLICCGAMAADAMKYQFKNNRAPVYEVNIKAEMPDCDEGHNGHLTYKITKVDSAGQITFDCEARLKTKVEKNDNARQTGMPRMMPGNTGGRELGSMIDSFGKVVLARSVRVGQQLPFLLGPVGELVIQPLSPDGKEGWKVDGPITLYTRPQQAFGFAPPMMFGQQEMKENAAHQTITFTRKETHGNLVTIARQSDLSTDDKVDGAPAERVTTDGEFVFNTTSGLVQSLEMKEVIEVHQKNVLVKVPVTVSARLLTGEDVDNWKKEEAAEAEQRQQELARRAQQESEQDRDTSGLPDGATKTEMIGGNGGSPYTKVNSEKKPVLGFQLKLGDWGGHKTIGQIEPLYEKPDNMDPNDAKVILARDGYVVGGVTIKKKEGADGIIVHFMKKTAAGVDARTAYDSPWFGYTGAGKRTVLGGDGKLVIGIFGRQGMNNDALGLVMAPATADK